MTPIYDFEMAGDTYEVDLPKKKNLPEAPHDYAVRQLGEHSFIFRPHPDGGYYCQGLYVGEDSNAFSEMSFVPPSPRDLMRGARNIAEDLWGL